MRNYLVAIAAALVLVAGGYSFAPRPVKDIVAGWFGLKPTNQAYKGNFRGDLEVLFYSLRSGDGELVELIMLKEPFGYTDSKGIDWDVPSGYISNGASIPKILWSVIGAPLSGPYRYAAVLHDYYCELQNRPWQQVHEMFFEASVNRGTDPEVAKVLYAGVLLGGPRWVEQKAEALKIGIEQAQVEPMTRFGLFGTPAMAQDATKIPFETEGKSSEQVFVALQEWIKKEKPSKDEILRMVEKVRKITIKKSQ